MKNTIYIFFLLIFLSNTAASQYDLQWYHIYDNPHPSYLDEAVGLVGDRSGNIYVTGTSFQKEFRSWRYDFATIKYSPAGDSLWVRRYDSSVLNENEDDAVDIGIDSENNIYVTGNTYDWYGTFSKVTTIKYDSTGNQKWVRTYRDSLMNPNLEVYDMTVDSDGNVYLVCSYYSHPYLSEIIKYNTSGDIVFIGKYYRRQSDINLLRSLSLDKAGNVYATGYAIDSGSANLDFLTVKFNISGILQWAVRTDQTGEDIAYSVINDDLGNTYTAGYSRTDIYDHQVSLMKYNSSGMQLWVKSYEGIYDGQGYYNYKKKKMLEIDNEGNVYLNFLKSRRIATGKFNPGGDLLWMNDYTYNMQSNQVARDFKIDMYNNVYVIGASVFDTSSNSFVILKYSSNGVIQNVIRNENQFTNIFSPAGLFVSVNGDISATGSAIPSYYREVPDYFTVKYSISTGVQMTSSLVPSVFKLHQNFPNPFNPSTKIQYEIPHSGDVTLKVFTLLGKEAVTLVNQKQNAGTYEVSFDGSNFSAGVYFYQLQSGNFSQTKKFVIVK